MGRLFLALVPLVLAGCAMSRRPPYGNVSDNALDNAESGIADYYYVHGVLPGNYDDIRGEVEPVVRGTAPGQNLTFSWTVLHPRGYDPARPMTAELRIVECDANTGKRICKLDGTIDLFQRGHAWAVITSFVAPHKSMVRDDPVNIACALARSVVGQHERTKRWVRLPKLPGGLHDPVLDQIRTYPSYRCFSYEVRRVNGAERLVFSSTQTNELYIFDPKGLPDGKGLEVVPKKP